MLQYDWYSKTILTSDDLTEMLQLFNNVTPKIGAFDTETNGLHITHSTPFLFQFGFIHPTEKKGYTYAIEVSNNIFKQVITEWHKCANQLDIYLGHNVKFDLHMLTNINQPYNGDNLSDTMFYIRYGHDALTPKKGGAPLKLKEYAAQFIDHKAKSHDNLLQIERSQIAKELNLKLKQRLSKCGSPGPKYKAKSYTLTVINNIFSDSIIEPNDLPENIREAYLDWLQQDVPIYLQPFITGLVDTSQIPYTVLNRINLLKYAHYDIIYTLEIYLSLKDIVKNRDNLIGIEMENKLIRPLYEMERVGFSIDKPYLEHCRKELKQYIKDQRNKLYELAGMELGIGQHELIKQLLNEKFNIPVTSTNSDELDQLCPYLIKKDPNNLGIVFIKLIQELRTLEKWYSTYIVRFLNDLKLEQRLYTTINQVGTVSGRVTSDFQQFPKTAIVTEDGKELFHPRKMIKITGGDYNAIIYLDFSQIELRFQAFYTILVNDPDLNLCRAYLPYQCVDKNNRMFDFNSYTDISKWNTESWYLAEDKSCRWVPTDVHTATTKEATGLDPSHPDFKLLRSTIGKVVNFAKFNLDKST